MKAIIYVGHGSRLASSNEKFRDFIKKVKMKVEFPLQEHAFLENARPSIEEVIDRCVRKGATSITVMPVLLMPGVHSNVDIPSEIEAAKDTHPRIEFCYGRPLGADWIVAQIINERLLQCGYGERENESVLLVAHGSRDSEAAVEFDKLAAMIDGDVVTGYLKQSPLWEMRIADCRNKVFVFPHLLFFRELTIKNSSDQVVVMCDPLGLDEKLTNLVVQRVFEARDVI
ncbi:MULTISPECIES: sirohydrochlorin chelatase [unclassified Bacillus (in: firmicutes)]|uniref:sirohydrochlorin chelatase n=1 Tax=unclassified Bacillus (in: firmicutes) TaxID=185979 RepID=UPI0008E6BF88|nr:MULTISPECIES: sirohydrochlorin chelatase [unclassified Bacillus (in: firmicutes)]SFB23468.1 sirohydrochlorin cobaltochelatase [Bacillus sp. UNCCL13]SFQ87771.1 sirohydrochlorin cobaltochelatase [Bacillus sp. cl95]